MLDRLLFIILVLNATDLFRFLAPRFGTSMGLVSLGLLCVQSFYLFARRRYTCRIFRQVDMKCWLLVLLVWPLLTVVYSPVIEFREMGVYFYYASLFCCAVVYCMSRGLGAMRRLLGVSFAVSLFGLVVSMLYPGYFEQVAAISQSRYYFGGRAFGFFMQPNRAACSLSLLFLGWYASWRNRTSMRGEAALALLLAAVLVTGSRIGTVAALILCAIIITHDWRKSVASLARLACLFRRTVFLAACLAGAVVGMYCVASSGAFHVKLSERIALLGRARLSEHTLAEDASLTARLDAQKVYRSLIWSRPIWGHGLGANTHYAERGDVLVRAHSSIHTLAMQYGVFYPITFILLLLVRMCCHPRRLHLENILGTNTILQFVAVTLLIFMISGGIDHSRAFYTVFGMIAAALYFPESLARHKLTLRSRGIKHRLAGWSRLGVIGPAGTFGQRGLSSCQPQR